MDYIFIIDELRAASLFDLFRLRAALSQKTATILTTDNQKWRVAYQFLFPVIESNE